jgi:hypothetical protein
MNAIRILLGVVILPPFAMSTVSPARANIIVTTTIITSADSAFGD